MRSNLRDLYGYVIEPAFRAEIKLLVSSDREIAELDSQAFVDPVGFPWTLERLRHLESRFRLAPGQDGQPPMTPIEAPLWTAMRELGLAPIAQYGIGPYRADFAFPDVRLVVECDGRQWHDPERDQRRDGDRDRLGPLAGPEASGGSFDHQNVLIGACRVSLLDRDHRGVLFVS